MPDNRFNVLTIGILALAIFMPELSLPASAFLPAEIDAVGNSGPNLEESNLLTEVGINKGNKLLYLHHGYNYQGNDNYYRRQGHNNYYRSQRYYGDHYSHYSHYSWPYLGLGLGFLYELGNARDYGYNGGDGHVQWCLKRYRSYNPRTDTFVGHDGHRHHCRSPYN